MRRSLYKYFTNLKYADAFLNGEVFFHSLAYFRDYEDKNVREDKNEGNSVYRPEDGLLITNHIQSKTFTMAGFAFESTANQEEILVFCVSRWLTDDLRKRFNAVACVEIFKIQTFCARIERALPLLATFRADRGDYYDPSEPPNPRWALPDQIAMSKFKSYAWQNEFRFVFCLTDALGFEKAALRLVKGDAREVPKPAEHHSHLLKARSLRDICRLHEF